jgi:hypothetical protein
MQASIATLTVAVTDLADKVNGRNPGSQRAKLTKSMVACPKSWDSKGDSAVARHFLAAYANWATF